MNETMFDLLKEWAELENVNCQVRPDAFAVRYAPHEWMWISAALKPVELMHIQYAVQQAIVARGWTMILDNEDFWKARVVSPKWEWAERGDNPAEALLRAFLEVLGKETK